MKKLFGTIAALVMLATSVFAGGWDGTYFGIALTSSQTDFEVGGESNFGNYPIKIIAENPGLSLRVGFNRSVGNVIVGIEGAYDTGSFGDVTIRTHSNTQAFATFNVSNELSIMGRVGHDAGVLMPFVFTGMSLATTSYSGKYWTFDNPPYNTSAASAYTVAPFIGLGTEIRLGDRTSIDLRYQITSRTLTAPVNFFGNPTQWNSEGSGLSDKVSLSINRRF